MNNSDYEVPPRSWKDISRTAHALRMVFDKLSEKKLDVIELLENALPLLWDKFNFEVAPACEMGNAEGLTSPDGTLIRLREDVYEKACQGNPRARFTVAHEIGHFLLHTHFSNGFAREIKNSDLKSLPVFRKAEPQANQFAAFLLMPFHMINKGDTVEDIAERFGVSFQAAENRLKTYHQKRI